MFVKVRKCVNVWVCANVWVCECVGFVMRGSFDNYAGVLVICVLLFTVFFFIFCAVFFVLFGLCIFILICFVCTSVRTIVTE